MASKKEQAETDYTSPKNRAEIEARFRESVLEAREERRKHFGHAYRPSRALDRALENSKPAASEDSDDNGSSRSESA